MHYSQIILNFINSKGISLYKLSQSTGISESTFSKWKSKPTSDISLAIVQRIADYFNVSFDNLLKYEDAEVIRLFKGQMDMSDFTLGEMIFIAIDYIFEVQKDLYSDCSDLEIMEIIAQKSNLQIGKLKEFKERLRYPAYEEFKSFESFFDSEHDATYKQILNKLYEGNYFSESESDKYDRINKKLDDLIQKLDDYINKPPF